MMLSQNIADGAHSKAEALVEGAVCDIDIGRVLLHADRVVAVADYPAQECDVVGIYGLRSDVNEGDFTI